jgi:cytoskeletal protein RodZ
MSLLIIAVVAVVIGVLVWYFMFNKPWYTSYLNNVCYKISNSQYLSSINFSFNSDGTVTVITTGANNQSTTTTAKITSLTATTVTLTDIVATDPNANMVLTQGTNGGLTAVSGNQTVTLTPATCPSSSSSSSSSAAASTSSSAAH